MEQLVESLHFKNVYYLTSIDLSPLATITGNPVETILRLGDETWNISCSISSSVRTLAANNGGTQQIRSWNRVRSTEKSW